MMSSPEVEKKKIWANREKRHETKTIKRSCCVNAEGWSGWVGGLLCEACWHLECMHAQTPDSSYSTVGQSLTTDIIQIAHHGRVVCPHRHPDSVCAENPTNGKQQFESVWSKQIQSAASFRHQSSCHSLGLLTAYPQKHRNNRA